MDKFYFEDLKYSKYMGVFNSYLNELKGTQWLRKPNIKWTEKEGTINAIVIRCNDMFITNDMKRNNDWLIVLENTPGDSFRRHIYKCTADPKFRKNDIANLCEQIYFGNIRNHRQQPNRLAICQDNCEIWVRRYENNEWFEEKGLFGINIHNPNGANNSSLGCVILASDDDYINDYRPMLKRVNNTNIPVAVIRDSKFEQFADEV